MRLNKCQAADTILTDAVEFFCKSYQNDFFIRDLYTLYDFSFKRPSYFTSKLIQYQTQKDNIKRSPF